jgi:hypothetical protein
VLRHVGSQPVVNGTGYVLIRTPGARKVEKYRSETHTTVTTAELERWTALEIAGRHRCVHRPDTTRRREALAL